MNFLSWVVISKNKKKRKSLNSQEIRLLVDWPITRESLKFHHFLSRCYARVCPEKNTQSPLRGTRRTIAPGTITQISQRKECLVSRFSISRYETERWSLSTPPACPVHDPFPEEELTTVRKEKEEKKRLSPKGAGNPVGSRGEYRFTDY